MKTSIHTISKKIYGVRFDGLRQFKYIISTIQRQCCANVAEALPDMQKCLILHINDKDYEKFIYFISIFLVFGMLM